MSSDVAIRVENLGKCYEIYEKPRDRLLQMLTRGRKQAQGIDTLGISRQYFAREVCGFLHAVGSIRAVRTPEKFR